MQQPTNAVCTGEVLTMMICGGDQTVKDAEDKDKKKKKKRDNSKQMYTHTRFMFF